MVANEGKPLNIYQEVFIFFTESIRDQCAAHLIKSVIDTSGMLCSNANFLKMGKDAMEPSSSSTTAERADTGRKPASETKSTEASV